MDRTREDFTRQSRHLVAVFFGFRCELIISCIVLLLENGIKGKTRLKLFVVRKSEQESVSSQTRDMLSIVNISMYLKLLSLSYIKIHDSCRNFIFMVAASILKQITSIPLLSPLVIIANIIVQLLLLSPLALCRPSGHIVGHGVTFSAASHVCVSILVVIIPGVWLRRCCS